jgi:hypothetical protein
MPGFAYAEEREAIRPNASLIRGVPLRILRGL